METEERYTEWRTIQKERERERRRLRDRQRRQSMSHEEREKHLARRRRNYQLRRQRAANAKLGIQQQVNFSSPTAAEPSIRNDIEALDFVSESSAQPADCAVQFAISEVNQVQNASALKHGSSETELPGSYNYPRVLRLIQIKQLARLLNSSADKPSLGSQEMRADASNNGEMAAPNGIPRKGIRLVHLKHLIRMLNSKLETLTSDQNNSAKMQGGENNVVQRGIEGSDRALGDQKAIDAIDENQQICADI